MVILLCWKREMITEAKRRRTDLDEKAPHSVDTTRSVRVVSVSTAASQALTKAEWLHAGLELA